jgi:1-acyl-sn-glycerol-3-phosphate acyltransferase
MSHSSPSRLLTRPGFSAFFGTQLLSAFNDNLFKNALVIWISAARAEAFGLEPATLISLCSAVFVAPFFVFSATAGQLADRFDKTQIVRIVKAAEVGIMTATAAAFAFLHLPLLLACLFAMGVHSAFLGPVKYSILPQLVSPDELVRANSLVEMGTFLAILAGTVGGGVLVLVHARGPELVGLCLVVLSLAGLAASYRMPRLAPTSPGLVIDRNPLTPTLQILRIVKKQRAVFLSVLGISWFWFVGAAFLSLLPVYVRETLHAHEHLVTLFLSVFCVGIAFGSLLTERISGKNLELGLVPFGSIGMTLFTLDLFFVGAPRFAAPGTLVDLSSFLGSFTGYRILFDLFGIACFGGFFSVPLYTLIQQRADETERSRVVAGNNIMNALFMVIGALMLSLLFASGVEVRYVFLVLSVLSFLSAVYIYSLLPEFLLRFFAWILSRTLYRLEVTGHEHIPETGPAVLVCNHVAFNDWLILSGSVRRPIRFVMDHRIAGTPVVSMLFKHGKTIPIAPAHEDEEVMEKAFARIAEELRNGEIVCIYPEGKITKTGEMNPFKTGIERILKETKVPVVPIALHGLWGSIFSRKGGPALRKWPSRFRARLSLRIDAPVSAEQATAKALEARVRSMLDAAAEVA